LRPALRYIIGERSNDEPPRPTRGGRRPAPPTPPTLHPAPHISRTVTRRKTQPRLRRADLDKRRSSPTAQRRRSQESSVHMGVGPHRGRAGARAAPSDHCRRRAQAMCWCGRVAGAAADTCRPTRAQRSVTSALLPPPPPACSPPPTSAAQSSLSSSCTRCNIACLLVSCTSPARKNSSRIMYTLLKLNTRSSSHTLPKN